MTMRKFKISIISALLCIASFNANSQSQADNELTNAVLKVYQDELSENPHNYNVFFRRAHLYYGLNQYLRASSDIDNAIKYTPSSEKDLLAEEYALRSNIYLMLDRMEDALADISTAYELDRSSYVYLYQKANLEYQLGRYDEAKTDYKRMQQFQNRSLESLIGLARVAVKENNLGLANEYVDQAVNMFPAESEAYLRRASVRTLMGNNTGAVDDLLIALSLDKKTGKPFNEIVKMSNIDYNAVISALSSTISKAPDTAIFYYIRGVIAQAHYHYQAAIADYKLMIDRKLYNSATVHESLAECYYALCHFEDALHEINTAIGMTGDNASYYITLSKIRLAMNDNVVAMEAANSALKKMPENYLALQQKALCAIKMGKGEEASNLLGEAIMNQSDDNRLCILRGWVLKNMLGKNADATTFYARAADVDSENYDIRTLYPFALLGLGRTSEAIEWTDKALEQKDIDGYQHYLGACVYAQAGKEDLAFNALEIALGLGYSDVYNLKFADEANITISPLRNDARFNMLIEKFSYLFKL